VLRKLGGDVTEKIYPGMGHTIIEDEIDHVEAILRTIGAPANR
jgi:phospholipase/carboxylesterase